MIALLTDFGESEYVGMMKGVIYSLHENATVVDLTHHISPQCIREGAWVLLQSYKFFPRGTVFVCVVDPGVGTDRDAIIVRTDDYVFVGPDNGLMVPASTSAGVKDILSIQIQDPVSKTFHGRDVFARIGAMIDRGDDTNTLGKRKDDFDVDLRFFLDGRSGEVVRIDHFGNIITNIPPLDKSQYELKSEHARRILSFYETYELGPDDDVFLVAGSSGTLEMSAKNGSATDHVELHVGDRITLE